MKYMEIYTALKADIANRVFTKGKRLPGEPELCRRFGTARNTVRQALDLLHRQGLIEKRKGEGTFITQRGERKTGLIGLLMPNFTSARFFDVLKRELETNAKGLGYRIAAETAATGTPQQIIDQVRTAARRLAVMRVEGVIFRPHLDPLCTKCNLEILHLFQNTETPVVLIDSDVATPPERSTCDLVAVDNITAGRRSAGHADLKRANGFRRALLKNKVSTIAYDQPLRVLPSPLCSAHANAPTPSSAATTRRPVA